MGAFATHKDDCYILPQQNSEFSTYTHQKRVWTGRNEPHQDETKFRKLTTRGKIFKYFWRLQTTHRF